MIAVLLDVKNVSESIMLNLCEGIGFNFIPLMYNNNNARRNLC